MKSRDNIAKFLSIFSALSSTVGSLDQSCQPPEQTDLPDPLQSIYTTHSTDILCQSHAICWLQLPCIGDMDSIVTGLCWAWDRHNLTIAETELDEWEENGRIWQWLRWSWTLEIMQATPFFLSPCRRIVTEVSYQWVWSSGFSRVCGVSRRIYLNFPKAEVTWRK